MFCEHPGCDRGIVVDCILPEDRRGDLAPGEPPVVYLCLKHCASHGYCWHCGFWEGRENLDRLGVCPSCRELLRKEMGEIY
ncbi:MAG: hypothetical protein KDI06_19050 [Calditrichaeota bacterium]|nr:hypothetical protein [Calditrichota bacterium]